MPPLYTYLLTIQTRIIVQKHSVKPCHHTSIASSCIALYNAARMTLFGVKELKIEPI